jgi:hypothetical protein
MASPGVAGFPLPGWAQPPSFLPMFMAPAPLFRAFSDSWQPIVPNLHRPTALLLRLGARHSGPFHPSTPVFFIFLALSLSFYFEYPLKQKLWLILFVVQMVETGKNGRGRVQNQVYEDRPYGSMERRG